MAYFRFLLLLTFLYATTLHAGEPDFPAPSNASVELVGENVTVSGNSMHIRQFYTRDRMEKVNEFYRRKWRRGEDNREPGYVESNAMTPWHIISRVEDGYLLTVQIQRADDGGSWGYLAKSRVDTEKPQYNGSLDIPRMADTQVLHHMQSEDSGQEGEVVLLGNEYSLASNVNYYRRYYKERDWREDLNQSIPAAKMHILSFTNGRHKINIMVTGDNHKAEIVVNRIIHDIL